MSLTVQQEIRLQPEELGIFVKPCPPKTKKWKLLDIFIYVQPAPKESGLIVFLARDNLGRAIKTADFIIAWHDGLAYPVQNYEGRYSLRLDRVYDPMVERGPYWGGISEEAIAPELHGFGIPRGHEVNIKVIFERI